MGEYSFALTLSPDVMEDEAAALRTLRWLWTVAAYTKAKYGLGPLMAAKATLTFNAEPVDKE